MAGFALPAMPLSSALTALFIFLPALYTEHKGLSGEAIGGIFLAAKLFDMLTDPAFGILADRYKTPWGRRRPWLVLGVPILTLALYRLYLPGEQVSEGYFAGWLILMYVGWTLATVSHTAWALELSDDYDQRSRITGWLQVAAMIGGILISLIPAAMERLGTPSYKEKAGWIGIFLVVSLPIAVVVCLLSVPERDVPRQPPIGWKLGVGAVLRNSALRRLLLVNALLTFAGAVGMGLFVFFVSHTLKLPTWIGALLMCLVIGGLLSVPVWIRLSEAWNKHQAVQAAALFGALASLLLLVLPVEGVALAAGAFLLIGVNTSANEFLPRTMMADVCDQDSVVTGTARMGLYYALLQFSSKAAAGLAIFFGFSMLTRLGFDPALGAANTPDSLLRLRYFVVGPPVLCYLAVIILLRDYPITRQTQLATRQMIGQQKPRDIS